MAPRNSRHRVTPVAAPAATGTAPSPQEANLFKPLLTHSDGASAPTASRGSAAQVSEYANPGYHWKKSPNYDLENGHSARYSDRMSMFCATVASSCHPSGAAHAKPVACPLLMTERAPARSALREESVMKGERRTARRPKPRSSDAPCRLASPRGVGSDTATPSRSRTSALCRQKCVRRHNAPRDRISPHDRIRQTRSATMSINSPRPSRPKKQLADLAHTATSAD